MRVRVWISPEEAFDWVRSELFVKQLQTANFRVGFEVGGNNRGVTINLVCHAFDLPVVAAAFKGQFLACELTPERECLPACPKQHGGESSSRITSLRLRTLICLPGPLSFTSRPLSPS